MKVSDVEKLLVRYYDGETDEAEERELRRFFVEEDVPTHLFAEKVFFRKLAGVDCNEEEPRVPEGLESRLNQAIDEWSVCDEQVSKTDRRVRCIRIGSMVASLLLLLSVGMFLYKTDTSPVLHDTCDTPEEAYIQTRKALIMLSSGLNKGMKQVEIVQRTAEKVHENINEQLNRINNMQ